jgi:hypothetical protein
MFSIYYKLQRKASFCTSHRTLITWITTAFNNTLAETASFISPRHISTASLTPMLVVVGGRNRHAQFTFALTSTPQQFASKRSHPLLHL